jgi:tetratricopeptide (TPR) repeat protein
LAIAVSDIIEKVLDELEGSLPNGEDDGWYGRIDDAMTLAMRLPYSRRRHEAELRVHQLRARYFEQFNVGRAAGARCGMGRQLVYVGRLDEGIKEYRNAFEELRTYSADFGLGSLLSFCCALIETERWEPALEWAALLLALGRSHGRRVDMCAGLVLLARVLMNLGRLDEAAQRLDELEAQGLTPGGGAEREVAELRAGIAQRRAAHG